MNLFHHEEESPVPAASVSNFKAPITHGEKRTSSFGKPSVVDSKPIPARVAESDVDSSAPPVVAEKQVIGTISSTSVANHPSIQPNLFGGQPGFANIIGYDEFGNPIYGQGQGNSPLGGVAQGLASGMAAGVAMDIVGDILGNLFSQ